MSLAIFSVKNLHHKNGKAYKELRYLVVDKDDQSSGWGRAIRCSEGVEENFVQQILLLQAANVISMFCGNS